MSKAPFKASWPCFICERSAGSYLLYFLLKNVIITNTARWLDTYNTYANLKEAYSAVNILTTDYAKYIFSISDKITYEKLDDVSLFITLNKD